MTAEFAGTLRERVVIERLVDERTSAGLQAEQWIEVGHCMAAVSTDGVGAEVEANTLSAMPRFKVTMRPRTGVSVGQRLRWRGQTMMVRQMLADPIAPDRLVLRCEGLRQ